MERIHTPCIKKYRNRNQNTRQLLNFCGKEPEAFWPRGWSTLARRKSEFKNIDAVAEEILRYCPWYRYDGKISTGKNSNRRISGSINEIKRILEFVHTPGADKQDGDDH
jgi:hypothetical protein